MDYVCVRLPHAIPFMAHSGSIFFPAALKQSVKGKLFGRYRRRSEVYSFSRSSLLEISFLFKAHRSGFCQVQANVHNRRKTFRDHVHLKVERLN